MSACICVCSKPPLLFGGGGGSSGCVTIAFVVGIS